MPLDDNSAGRADHLVAASPDVGPDTQARRSRSANEGGPHGLAGQSPLLPTLSGASSLTDEPVT
ncbi:MAG: hypothetical protein LBL92_00790, partial [Propionibacteriaceae bacterium]|nr:hypothetical protein [Propionibacteriaceae bacterium]